MSSPMVAAAPFREAFKQKDFVVTAEVGFRGSSLGLLVRTGLWCLFGRSGWTDGRNEVGEGGSGSPAGNARGELASEGVIASDASSCHGGFSFHQRFVCRCGETGSVYVA